MLSFAANYKGKGAGWRGGQEGGEGCGRGRGGIPHSSAVHFLLVSVCLRHGLEQISACLPAC